MLEEKERRSAYRKYLTQQSNQIKDLETREKILKKLKNAKTDMALGKIAEQMDDIIEHQNDDDDMMGKLLSKLDEMRERQATIQKTFSFSMEDLQDTPAVCLSEIYQYLTLHRDKIKEFWFTSNVDIETFKPLLTIHMIPVDEIAEELSSSRNSIWSKLTESI